MSIVNSSGQPVQRRVDTYHGGKLRMYCGLFVDQSGYMNPCGRCNGRCGPNNGCQCKSCYELDMEIFKRSLILDCTNEDKLPINDAGAKCHVSYDAQSRHNLQGGYKFYCGRNVGSEGYHNRCTSCDGTCGPDNGCQCRSCYALEQKIEILKLPCTNNRKQRTKLKFDDIHTNAMRHYCGVCYSHREMHDPCNQCSLSCGPDHGCQCNGCFELDLEYTTRSEHLGIDLYHMHNADGAVVSISYCARNTHDTTSGEYRFYCGRKVGRAQYHTQCTSCDGQCGPTDGCQCVACYELEQIYRGTLNAPALLPQPPVPQVVTAAPPSTPIQPLAAPSVPSSSQKISQKDPKVSIDEEIASFTTFEECDKMTVWLEKWKILLTEKRVSTLLI